MRLIKTTYDVVTEESAKDGDFAETGWKDEDGYGFEPDADDVEEYGTESGAAVALAVKFLQGHGGLEPSSSQYCPRVWYTETDPEINYATGEETRLSFHLSGWTDEEGRAIFDAITGRKTNRV